MEQQQQPQQQQQQQPQTRKERITPEQSQLIDKVIRENELLKSSLLSGNMPINLRRDIQREIKEKYNIEVSFTVLCKKITILSQELHGKPTKEEIDIKDQLEHIALMLKQIEQRFSKICESLPQPIQQVE